MTTQCLIKFFKQVTNVRVNSRPGETYPYVGTICLVTVCGHYLWSLCVWSLCVWVLCVCSLCDLSLCVWSLCVRSLCVCSLCDLSLCVWSLCLWSLCMFVSQVGGNVNPIFYSHNWPSCYTTENFLTYWLGFPWAAQAGTQLGRGLAGTMGGGWLHQWWQATANEIGGQLTHRIETIRVWKLMWALKDICISEQGGGLIRGLLTKVQAWPVVDLDCMVTEVWLVSRRSGQGIQVRFSDVPNTPD